MPDLRRRFLTVAHQRLLHQLVSGWRRRGTTLLQIGLDTGFSPEFFWEAGFDVTAVDRSLECLESARKQTGPKVAYSCAVPAGLPFDDGEFDYAVLMHRGLKNPADTAGEDVPPELAEALRVASRGVILLEWNRFSLTGVLRSARDPWGSCEGKADAASPSENVSIPRSVLPWDLYAMVRRACPTRRIRLFSSLPLWEWTWPGGRNSVPAVLRKVFACANLTPTPLPLGALIGVRVDWTSIPLTPVGMLSKAAASLYPAKPQREEIMGRAAQAVLTEREKRK